MSKRKGDLFVISAPSGTGKTTLARALLKLLPDLRHSVSYTTRKRRPGEIDGIDYRFISEAEFTRMAEACEFLEWAKVHGNFYGTSEKALKAMTGQGVDVLLDIDTQGARQTREKLPDAVLIFILPPSLKTLKERLVGRKSDSPEDIKKRLKRALDEIKEYKIYDYVILNDKLEEALEELKAVVLARRASVSKVDPDWVKSQFLR